MWDARLEPGVVDAFARIWGTDELIVSFDSLNITFPNRKDVPRKGSWEHVDQSPLRRGMHCVQGIINLSTAGPDDGGLVVYPGSHKYLEEFLTTQTDPSTWESKDLFWFRPEQLAWFQKEKGYNSTNRTIHYGAEPTEASNTIRTVIYAAYSPSKLASTETLKWKAEVFRNYGGTTHWPHDNIVIRKRGAILPNGTPDPRDREVPLELPEMTDGLLKLAGVLPY
ncbi:hypothetical protein F66182_16024 [Fusarium sp. NRRL 66182]|nr:hypothetical protein F66182_16024 [Fusarium sp. NRRL 66182]